MVDQVKTGFESPYGISVVEGSAEAAEQVFVDGFLNSIISPSVTKLSLYQVVSVDHGAKQELRKGTVTLVVPTHNLVEFCSKFLANMASNRESILLGSTAEGEKMVRFLQDIRPTPSTKADAEQETKPPPKRVK